jgi:hypothetical protein
MSLRSSSDIFLPETAGFTVGPSRARIAAFVPIVVALAGVSMILFGGLSARDTRNTVKPIAVDPIVTGSIVASDDQRPVLELLGR